MTIWESKLKEIGILLSGIFLGGILSDDIKDKELYFILGIISFLIGVGIITFFKDLFLSLLKNILLYFEIIAISYNKDFAFERNQHWIEIKLEKLVFIIQAHFKYLILRNELMYIFPVIVNPYGSTYIEKDILNRNTLRVIVKYVSEGGVYVNLADVPFWYSNSPDSIGLQETTPFIGSLSNTKAYRDSLISKFTGISFAGSHLVEDKFLIEKFVYLENQNFVNLWNKDYPNIIENTNSRFSPFVRVKLGKGYFLISTIKLDEDNYKDHLDRIMDKIKETLILIKRKI